MRPHYIAYNHKLHALCICLKLEATPHSVTPHGKHMHGWRILSGELIVMASLSINCMLVTCDQGWVSAGRNLFLPDIWFKLD